MNEPPNRHEQTKETTRPDVIVFPFDPDRTPRELFDEALARVSPQPCPQHPDQVLAVDATATIRRALGQDYLNESLPQQDFSATFSRCSRCPHSNAHHDSYVELCPIGFVRIGTRDCCARDEQGRAVPDLFGSEPLEADRTPREQFDEWVARKAVLRCRLSKELLRRREVRVQPPFEHWSIQPRFRPCLSCRLETLGVSPDEASASFDNFITDPPVLKEILDTCRAFAANPKGVLLLLGGCGTGKTHLAIAVLRELLRSPSPDLAFIKHRHFVAAHWISLRPVPFGEDAPESPLLACQKAKVLVYDEVAASADNRSSEDVLLDLFEFRIGHFRPTIITANLTKEELETVLGTRLHDRLKRAVFAVLEFGFESKRKLLNSNYLSDHPPLKIA